MQNKKSPFSRVFATFLVLLLIVGYSWPVLAQSNVTLLVHDAKAQVIPGSSAYKVEVYYSLLDSAGNPIKDATLEDFTLSEDGQPVQIVSLDPADEPINVAIVLDASGSMLGEKMDAALAAASKFIEDLESSDKVAVISFDEHGADLLIDFTTDHAAALDQVALLDATLNGGTCLYDAAYQTVQQAAALPSGRRAVILLTDGKDEYDGQPCSNHTVEEVIALATDSETRVPIYTIGLGSGVDANILGRLANRTGGRYQESPGPTQLDALFGRLSDELRSQFVITYTSTTDPGEHTLTLEVNYHSAKDEVSRTVEMPALPYSIAFTAPEAGAQVTGTNTITVTVSGQGAPIQQILFLANGVSLGTDTTAPYEFEWDPTSLEEGSVFLEAIAQDAGGVELARSGVNVTYKKSIIPDLGGPDNKPLDLNSTTIYIIVSVLMVIIGVIIYVIVVAAKKRKSEKDRDKRWQEAVQGIGVPSSGMDDRTMDSFTPSEYALGVLVILQSDDPAMLHQRIEISKSATSLGRKADNDIIFSKDSPVSRHHAVIEERSGQLYLSEIMSADETGQSKRPAYGTFINGRQIDGSAPLHDGDTIQLGKRVQIRFEGVNHTSTSGDDHTMDQFSNTDNEATMDDGGTRS